MLLLPPKIAVNKDFDSTCDVHVIETSTILNVNIPPMLIDAVRTGRAVLVLGAGSSLASKGPTGKRAPGAQELADLLAEQFLDNSYKGKALASVGQYAVDNAGQADVELYIREVYEPLLPTVAHKTLPTLVWKALITTNYDRLVEKGYESISKPAQKLFPLISNMDRISNEMEGRESVQLLKIHGCISSNPNPNCPLILSHDQYIAHRQGRDKLFDIMRQLCYDYPFVFVGQSVTDPDLRQIVLEVLQVAPNRPEFYIVAPDIDDIQKASWAKKRVTAIKGTFGTLMETLDAEVPKNARSPLQTLLDLEHPISSNFVLSGARSSPKLLSFLDHDVDYVGSVDRLSNITPSEFYKGHNPTWSAIAQSLDIEREIYNSLLSNIIMLDESDRKKKVEVFIVKGASGSGKSVVMQRLAWSAGKDLELICLYAKDGSNLNPDSIAEILEKCKQRLFLFIDNAADRIFQIKNLIDKLPMAQLTIIAAERSNEWNVSSGPIEDWVVHEFEIGTISRREATSLVEVLDIHDCLGALKGQPKSKIVEEFIQRSYKHLLVALYEVTFGKRFEEIIVDEYREIGNAEAKSIYLSICVLNRFNIAVRAGVISRIHDLPFVEFKDRFFRPLEHIVYTAIDQNTDDHVYKARHPIIADIVFHEVLSNGEERYDEVVKVLTGLNPMYSLDRQVLRELLRGRSLHEAFPSHDHVAGIYRLAQNSYSEDHYFLQQEAIYEMVRENGNLKRAKELLSRAQTMAPKDTSIKHSLAELQISFADAAKTIVERNRHLNEAEKIAESLKASTQDSFPFHTLIKIDLRRLRSLVDEAEDLPQEYEFTIKRIEEHLTSGLQRFPGDSYLKTAEAQFATILRDEIRIKRALEASFLKNPRNAAVANRLAKIHLDEGNTEEARIILERSLEANPASPLLHYSMSRLLIGAHSDCGQVLYHLQRSYTHGDRNFEAQVLHARQLILCDHSDEAVQVFARLDSARGNYPGRAERLWIVDRPFSGYVKKLDQGFALIQWDKWTRWVFASRNDSSQEWESLREGHLVIFDICFNLIGPVAINVRPSEGFGSVDGKLS